MTKKQKLLAAQFLETLAEEMLSAGCNDWEWPESWSGCERDQFAREYHRLNGDPEEFEPGQDLPDFCAVYLLAHAIKLSV